ncbi:hypothetical protein J3U64_04400 [Snodgrassella sp. B3800]|uniref:hypothetical protein n=1 Tax=Snodgrassella sp. B3800 TaxID=2818039 RepID=UPI00226A9775|nr:hypothetical protein [Snodgrassella sp. B3800]MCX8746703.1 hypothetical protein [Snodgrassella sp. B3800]
MATDNPFRLENFNPLSNCTFINDEQLVREELKAINTVLTPDLFKNVLQEALIDTQNLRAPTAPKSAFKNIISSSVVTFLRNKLVPYGWTSYEGRGDISFTITPNKTNAIYVTLGNEDVGKKKGYPTNSAKKGSELSKAYSDPQFYFDQHTKIYILLLHFDSDKLNIELSIPRKFSKGHVEEWEKRIILPTFNYNTFSSNTIAQLPKPAQIDNGLIKRKSL